MNATETRRTDIAEYDSPEQRGADQNPFVELEPPRFEDGTALLIAGLKGHYNCSTRTEIPLLWQRFLFFIGDINGQVGYKAYGVLFNCDAAGNFDYMSGVEVASADRLPAEFSTVAIPEQSYIVFSHKGPVSDIHRTAHAIWTKWMPESEYSAADTPHFERYPEDFNPATDSTGVEIWIPKGDKR